MFSVQTRSLLLKRVSNQWLENTQEDLQAFEVYLCSSPISFTLWSIIVLYEQDKFELSDFLDRTFLGSGNFSTIYKAVHIYTKTEVALKIIDKDKVFDMLSHVFSMP